ncbi:hypothetical protein BDN70DRAFT_722764 [Pholiota conissans]|uniref:Uncharacterized protein n=1 Tax=Pholiota conissans TaxID=109636 RepID=A0A9P5YZW3_9AGAR|nr:hypothetical protein BDN70DRAFT_722764 [Pholiota conissans]
MSSELIIPLDIIEVIIYNLAQIDDPKRTSLWACARTCRHLLHVCRRYIFWAIELSDDDLSLPHKESPSGIQKLLESTPEIATYTRSMHFRISGSTHPNLENFGDLSRILNNFTLIQVLYVKSELEAPAMADWNVIPECLREVIVNLMKVPTLLTVSLSGISNFPVETLAHCINMRSLLIKFVTPANNAISTPSNTRPITLREYGGPMKSGGAMKKLISLKGANGQPVFDFQYVDHCTAYSQDMEDVEAVQWILQRSTRMTYFGLTVLEPSNFSHFSETLFRAPGTLTRIFFRCIASLNSQSPLNGLPGQLDDIRQQPNVLEEVGMNFRHSYPLEPNNEWNELDNTLNGSGWPSLKIVSIHITIASMVGNIIEGWVPQFPGLSANENITLEIFVNDIKIPTSVARE